jgi:hypothetical protein
MKAAIGVGAQHDAEPAPSQKPRQPLLAVEERQAAKILTIEFQQVEPVQDGLADGPMPVESVKDRWLALSTVPCFRARGS